MWGVGCAMVALLTSAVDAATASATRTNRQLNTDERAVMYWASMSYSALNGCKVVPATATFRLECGPGGTIRSLDDEENLGLAACEESVDLSSGRTILRCTETSLNSIGDSNANVVFQCVGNSPEQWQAVVSLETDNNNADCSASQLGFDSMSVSIAVQLLCGGPIQGPFGAVSHNLDGTCTNGQSLFTGTNLAQACISITECGLGMPSCYEGLMPLADVSLQVSLPQDDASALAAFQDECLWDVPSHASKLPSSLATQVLPNQQQQATYELGFGFSVLLTELGGDCTLKSPTKFSLQCGTSTIHSENDNGGAVPEKGTLVVLDENDNPRDGTFLDTELGCIIVDHATMECWTDYSGGTNDTSFERTLYVACIGDTLPKLSLTARWDPESMTCSSGNGTVLEDFSLVTVSYYISLYQTCPNPYLDLPPPFDIYANILGQDCMPITSHLYESFSIEVGEDEDNNGVIEEDETETVSRVYEFCTLFRGNCHNGDFVTKTLVPSKPVSVQRNLWRIVSRLQWLCWTRQTTANMEMGVTTGRLRVRRAATIVHPSLPIRLLLGPRQLPTTTTFVAGPVR